MTQKKTSPSTANSDTPGIILELLPETEETNPALVNATGRALVNSLQRDGYTLRPVYTAQRGGLFLVEVVNAITQAATFVWANRTSFEEALNDTGALVTIMSGAVPLIKRMVHAHEVQVGKDEEALRPIKISLMIDGAQIEVEAKDIAQAGAALALAQRFSAAHPHAAKQVSARSKTKVQGRIRPQPRRRRK